MNVILSAISEGLYWSILALGVYISFRILRQPDMTVEGSFPLGAAVAAVLIAEGVNPLLASLAAMLAGTLAGMATGLLSTKAKVPALLSGVLTMTGLYSINLRIMGQSNITLLNEARLTNVFQVLLGIPQPFAGILLGVVILAVIIFLLSQFFQTDMGQALVATGNNEDMARAMGISTDTMKVLALGLSNGLIGLSGGLMAQFNGYADLSMGIGTMVIGLAAIIIAETLYQDLSLTGRFVSLPVGSIIYRLIIAGVLWLGMDPGDLKLISAIMLAVFIAVPNMIQAYKIRHYNVEASEEDES